MNNLLSYCGLVDAKIRASDKNLSVPYPQFELSMATNVWEVLQIQQKLKLLDSRDRQVFIQSSYLVQIK